MKQFHYKGSLPLSNGAGIALGKSLGISVTPVVREKRQKFNIVTKGA